jgi:WD40 repeat protein
VIISSQNFTLEMYDENTGFIVQRFVGHSNMIREVEYLSTTEFLSTSEDKTIRLWNIASGKCIRATSTSTNIYAIEKINDTVLVGSAQDGSYKYYNFRTGALLKSKSGAHGFWVFTLTVLKNNRLVTGSFDGAVKFWDLKNDSLIVAHPNAHGCGYIYATEQLGDGKVITGANECGIAVWEPINFTKIKTISHHSNYLRVLDGISLIGSGQEFNSYIYLYDAENEFSLIGTCVGHSGSLRIMDMTDEGTVISVN